MRFIWLRSSPEQNQYKNHLRITVILDNGWETKIKKYNFYQLLAYSLVCYCQYFFVWGFYLSFYLFIFRNGGIIIILSIDTEQSPSGKTTKYISNIGGPNQYNNQIFGYSNPWPVHGSPSSLEKFVESRPFIQTKDLCLQTIAEPVSHK